MKKLLTVFLFLSLFSLNAEGYSQNTIAAPSKEFQEWKNESNFHGGERPSPIDDSHLSKRFSRTASVRANFRDTENNLPASYDLRNFERVTDVKDQGEYSACWTFAALGSMESNYVSQNLSFVENSPDLSELHMSWFCYKDPEPENNFYIIPSYATASTEELIMGQGGNIYMSLAYLTRLSGTVHESSLPYENASSMSEMPADPSEYHPVILRVKNADYFGTLSPSADSETRENIKNAIKKSIIQNGAVQISYYSRSGMYKKSGDFTTYFSNYGTRTNHAVLIVGWDDDFSASNFNNNDPNTIPSSNGAWIIKNSWAPDWGDEGYFYMSYEQHLVRVTSLTVKENEKGIKHYGHDSLGWVNNVSTKWQANIFKSERENEVIKEIGFYTTGNNVSCDFYIFDLGSDTPSSPLPDDIDAPLFSVKDFHVETAGYHLFEIGEALPVSEGNYFSIVAKINSDYAYPAAVECYSEEYADPVINSGESFFSSDSSEILSSSLEWTDGTGYNDPMNSCLKIFTIQASPVTEEKIPDEGLRNYVLDILDLDGDGYISEHEISKATEINVSGINLKNLNGLEIFTAAESLDCSQNNLLSIDLTWAESLVSLDCKSQDSGLKIRAERTSKTIYKYKIDLKDLDLASEILEKISDVTAENTQSKFYGKNLTAEFEEFPTQIIYWYDTGFKDILMPVYVKISNSPTPDPEPEPESPEETLSSPSSGCDATGTGILAFMILTMLTRKKR